MTIRTVTVWKNAEARSRLEAWYARFEARAGVPVEHRQVTTRYGDSHLILAGPPDAPPIVCLHPMRTGAAHLLPELGRLPRDFRVLAPDLPGQSVRGLQVRLPLDDDSVARWLLDVLDALALDRVDLFGVSWGGFAARLTRASWHPMGSQWGRIYIVDISSLHARVACVGACQQGWCPG